MSGRDPLYDYFGDSSIFNCEFLVFILFVGSTLALLLLRGLFATFEDFFSMLPWVITWMFRRRARFSCELVEYLELDINASLPPIVPSPFSPYDCFSFGL